MPKIFSSFIHGSESREFFKTVKKFIGRPKMRFVDVKARKWQFSSTRDTDYDDDELKIAQKLNFD